MWKDVYDIFPNQIPHGTTQKYQDVNREFRVVNVILHRSSALERQNIVCILTPIYLKE
jgi:hypothetical protein